MVMQTTWTIKGDVERLSQPSLQTDYASTTNKTVQESVQMQGAKNSYKMMDAQHLRDARVHTNLYKIHAAWQLLIQVISTKARC